MFNAMVTHYLRVPYLDYFTKNLRFYGAWPAAGTIVGKKIKFLDIIQCPVKFMYYMYLKFHGARTVFCRVNEGKVTPTGHRAIFLI